MAGGGHRLGWGKRALFTAVPFVLFLLLLEGGLRVFGYQPRVNRNRASVGRTIIERPAPGIPYLYQPNVPFRQKWPSNPRGYFDRGNTVRYRVNNAGFRGADFAKQRTAAKRVVFLGDSFCWGNGVKLPDHFQSILASKVGPQAEILNFGLGSYSTAEEVALFEHTVLDYSPQVAVIWFFLNDFDNRNGTMNHMGADDLLRPLRHRLYSADLFLAPVDAWLGHQRLVRTYQEAFVDGAPGWRQIQTALRRFVKLCEAGGIVPMLAIHPVLIQLDGSYPFAAAHGQVERFAREIGFHTVDLLPAFEGQQAQDLWVHRSDQHPNDRAHRLAAQHFAPHLRKVLSKL